MRVLTSLQASEDLQDIFDYISADSAQTAHKVAERVIEAIDSLGRLESRGRKGQVEGTLERVVPLTGCMLIYRVDADEVVILRVWRSARGHPVLR